ncbi:hypothetical protein BD310DRAFT_951832 [Dichomitus squalens]|uniref:Uncharacterized protein n=1 Tax=Dichomitus squalens TaxID=114155 RepID=A0A4Q9PIB9_9APHY|nr:hypothetical protein BD310DRAFT_951832 [Dichomitus squalens]
MPNPDRAIGAGLEWECPPLIVFIDDVSGNTSKQWNVHYSCYMSIASMPRAELEKTRHIKFVATSPHASPMEIMEAVCGEIRKAGGTSPVKVWDSIRKRYILVRLWILFLAGDNPMQAELCSHIGLKGNHFCRCCHVGGDGKFKSSDEGFQTSSMATRPITATRDAIVAQLLLATHAAAEKPLKEAITASGIKDSLAMPMINRLIALGKILRRSTPTRKALSPEEVNNELYNELLKKKDTNLINPLLRMEGLDVHRDTPVEPLHTHLLGIVKYFWAQTVWVLEKQGKFSEFQARLNSVARSGLKIPSIMADYMCRYRGALIGKHFKTISQVVSFALFGLVDITLQRAWLAVGHLTVLLWETEIDDINIYLPDLRRAIQDVIDFAAALSPGLLTEKNKFHILSHIPDHIERHGPAILFSTERYESFNHVFRLCSIHSNRQAPSRDIAMAFANQDQCRHMVTGGYWLDPDSQQWVCASRAVQDHIEHDSLDARLLGVPIEKLAVPGRMLLNASPHRPHGAARMSAPSLPWHETSSFQADSSLQPPANSPGPWQTASSVVALSGDEAGIGAEVLISFQPSAACSSSTLHFASVVELLRPLDPRQAPLVVVRESVLWDALHLDFHMPVVSRTGRLRILKAENVVCTVNVQHDCARGQCDTTGTEAIRQEREMTSRSRAVVAHRPTPFYVVNRHAIHNQRLIRTALPPYLQVRPTFFSDRTSLYLTAAASLRDTKLQKKIAHLIGLDEPAAPDTADINGPTTTPTLSATDVSEEAA